MSMAMKYGMKKKAAKLGAACEEHGAMSCKMCQGGMMADGGMVSAEKESEDQVAHMPMARSEAPKDDKDDPLEKGASGIVDRIIKSFAKGGMVANDSMPEADFEPAEFDDLAKEDTESSDYVDDGSGDEQEDDDRKDIVSRIMKSRGKKDKMPRPA